MRNIIKTKAILVIVLIFIFAIVNACGSDDGSIEDSMLVSTITDTEQEALLFMLEEEKLARDTYMFLGNLWAINQFYNIQKSEQTHMDAIENLLLQSNTDYNILPVGEFANQKLQSLYNQFKIDGAINQANALQIGATIEDLDIVDLQEYIDKNYKTTIISVFESLQCGSRNHLKSFLLAIENAGNTYTPQYLSQDEYSVIISGPREKCN
ncbi:DUF2202 domain-containing protein [Thalassobellus citreus]|uniref:DUF2202 domain-containing protein n=1 Tax=Thalassobellus citreus TaxID=3367752 RepID=UPI003794A547